MALWALRTRTPGRLVAVKGVVRRASWCHLPVAVVTRDPAFAVDSGTVAAASPEQAVAELSARGVTTAFWPADHT